MQKLKVALDWMLRMTGLAALVVLALQWSDSERRQLVEPPPGMATLADFRRWQPAKDEATRIDNGGVIYYLVRGDTGRTLASGPAGYVFDARGHFIGWSRDLGDDHQLAIAADGRGQRTTVKLPEINGR